MRTCSDLMLLHPLVRVKTLEMVTRLDDEKLNFAPFETFRDPLRQFHLWAQSRLHPGKEVTKVPIGFHCFGLAVDFVLYDPITRKFSGEFSWKYEGNEDKWARLGEIGQEVGFFWGGMWKPRIDRPHFQLSGTMSVNDIIYKGVVPYSDCTLVGMDEYTTFLENVINYSKNIMHSINNDYALLKGGL